MRRGLLAGEVARRGKPPSHRACPAGCVPPHAPFRRRAAHPGNLHGSLVTSAALLIRLLPLAQLLLMRFLYFVVRSEGGGGTCGVAACGHGQRTEHVTACSPSIAQPSSQREGRAVVAGCQPTLITPSMPMPCAPPAGRARHGARVLDRPGGLAALCGRAAARAAGPGAAPTQVRGCGNGWLTVEPANGSAQPLSTCRARRAHTHTHTILQTLPATLRSTVTGGLSYQETLGSGLRQGQDDAYAAEASSQGDAAGSRGAVLLSGGLCGG